MTFKTPPKCQKYVEIKPQKMHPQVGDGSVGKVLAPEVSTTEHDSF